MLDTGGFFPWNGVTLETEPWRLVINVNSFTFKMLLKYRYAVLCMQLEKTK